MECAIKDDFALCSALALKEKGLRPIAGWSFREQLLEFSTGPERKGIETLCELSPHPLRWRSALALKEKGLRLEGAAFPFILKFSTGPERKGIETPTSWVSPLFGGSSALALKEKGLKPADFRVLDRKCRSALALKEKGLRP